MSACGGQAGVLQIKSAFSRQLKPDCSHSAWTMLSIFVRNETDGRCISNDALTMSQTSLAKRHDNDKTHFQFPRPALHDAYQMQDSGAQACRSNGNSPTGRNYPRNCWSSSGLNRLSSSLANRRRNSRGDNPKCSLKVREKTSGEAKPHEIAISWIGKSL